MITEETITEDKTRRWVLGSGIAGAAAFGGASKARASDDPHCRNDEHSFVLTPDHTMLDAEAVNAEAAGNTLIGTVHDRESFALYLAPDGTASLRIGDREEAGTWTVDADGIIRSQWPTVAGGTQLELRYYRDSDGYYCGIDQNTMRWSNFVIEPGDSRELGG
ncbi:hypothetical protein [Bauldia sp.]|uniref:hypothetical protein n=1 Tax=Bauldia sp. TaxID=2575872 RepID=UPI003BA9D843